MRTKTKIVAVNQERAEQCQAQREARRRDIVRENDQEPECANRYSQARHVACEQVKIPYKPIKFPRSFNELEAVRCHAPGAERMVPKSWEILTEANR